MAEVEPIANGAVNRGIMSEERGVQHTHCTGLSTCRADALGTRTSVSCKVPLGQPCLLEQYLYIPLPASLPCQKYHHQLTPYLSATSFLCHHSFKAEPNAILANQNEVFRNSRGRWLGCCRSGPRAMRCCRCKSTNLRCMCLPKLTLDQLKKLILG